MMKKTAISLLALFLTVTAGSQELNEASIQKIRGSLEMDAYTKAMQNVLSNNEVKKLAKKLENVDKDDHFFTYKVEVNGIYSLKNVTSGPIYASNFSI